MSWHWVSVRGAKGERTPSCLASASTFVRYVAESVLLEAAVSAGSAATASVNLVRAESSRVTGPPAFPPRPPRPPRPPTACGPHPGAPPRPPRPPVRLTPNTRARESTDALQTAE